MRKIPLPKNRFAIVDDEDYPFLSRFKWHFASMKNNKSCVVSCFQGINGGVYSIAMSQLLLTGHRGRLFRTFHINGNLLDYRKKNIKHERVGVILHNAPKKSGTTSKYKGVYFDYKYRRYRAYISHNYKRTWLGSFDTEIKAVEAYNKKSLELYGEFAYQNKI